MARPSVKRELVWEYLDENWPFAKKDSIVADTGVSPQYAYMLLREYELIQKRLGNVHSSGRTDEVTRYKEPATLEAESPLVHKTQQSGEKLGQEAQLESTMQVSEGISDGSTASYYELPDGATELQDLISYKNMNAQIGEIFRACMRYGESSHSNELRDAKKIKFYVDAEIKRLGG
tara:strand:+ start:1836 stop:2363 length:528 start_codon:yes stop_codon:yes gene_type:complete